MPLGHATRQATTRDRSRLRGASGRVPRVRDAHARRRQPVERHRAPRTRALAIPSFAFDPSADRTRLLRGDVPRDRQLLGHDRLRPCSTSSTSGTGTATSSARDTRTRSQQRFLAFKYWYTEPTPAGLVDNKWYWSENHRIIFHVDEYLAGHAFPDATFTNDGRTGAAHAQAAEARILGWLDEKVRFGFTEWHSDVYYQKDVTPLLTLVEFAPDPRPRGRVRRWCSTSCPPRHRAPPAARQLRRDARPLVHEGQEHRRRPGHVRVREDRCSTTPSEPYQPRHDAGGDVVRSRTEVPRARRDRADRPERRAARRHRAHERAARSVRARHRRTRGRRTARVRRSGERPVLVGARRAQRLAARAHDDRDARPARRSGTAQFFSSFKPLRDSCRRRHGRRRARSPATLAPVLELRPADRGAHVHVPHRAT